MTAKDVVALNAARPFIPPGAAISITHLPKETLEARVAAAATVRRCGFQPVPHISARRLRSEAHLRGYLARLSAEAAVERVFVVAGDLDDVEGPYEDSLAVIRSGLLDAFGVRCVGVAGHPEGHGQVPEPLLWEALEDKTALLREQGLGCEIVTQFGFDAEPVLAWLAHLRRRGVVAPVRVGLPGPASVTTLLRFAARCGVGASSKVLAKYGISMGRLIGSAGPDRVVEALAEGLTPSVHGEVKLHLYPFGGLARTAEWAHAYSRSAEPVSHVALA